MLLLPQQQQYLLGYDGCSTLVQPSLNRFPTESPLAAYLNGWQF